MRNFIFVAIFFVFSNIFSSNLIIDIDSIQEYMKNRGVFTDSGIKVVYKTDLSEEEIINNIKNDINIYRFDKVNNRIKFNIDSMEVLVDIWQDEVTNVSIQIINYDSKMSIEDILRIAQKLIYNDNSRKVYSYCRYKVDGYKENIDDILPKSMEKLNEIEIYNGKIFNIELINKTKVNLAYMTYDTGNYVIIGTPMIFVTY